MTTATLHTTLGDITINLFPDHAPKTVANFVGLANGTKEWQDRRTRATRNDALYTNVIFHRVIPGFMIQGGDPEGTGMGGPGYNFADEFHPELTFDRPYLLAMANAGPNTNGSQFFITVAPTTWLNFKHSIFGEVADEAAGTFDVGLVSFDVEGAVGEARADIEGGFQQANVLVAGSV